MAVAMAGAGAARVMAVEDAGSRAGVSFLAPVLNLESVVQGLLVAVVVGLIIAKLRAPKLKLPPGPVALPIVGNWLQVCSRCSVPSSITQYNLGCLAIALRLSIAFFIPATKIWQCKRVKL